MSLNHLNLPVPDPAASGSFFVEHLGFRMIGHDGLR
ncbi:MAG: VOC family protein [Steroidobacteraceae bacterium]|jgi:catechol 2,3-dioxygenase-like lactoylglutathione lyase family enzyme|nr:VOC family protein [Steroidobacteraceae bacterium]